MLLVKECYCTEKVADKSKIYCIRPYKANYVSGTFQTQNDINTIMMVHSS